MLTVSPALTSERMTAHARVGRIHHRFPATSHEEARRELDSSPRLRTVCVKTTRSPGPNHEVASGCSR